MRVRKSFKNQIEMLELKNSINEMKNAIEHQHRTRSGKKKKRKEINKLEERNLKHPIKNKEKGMKKSKENPHGSWELNNNNKKKIMSESLGFQEKTGGKE